MSAWTKETWGLFFDLLDKGWPGELKPGEDSAYMVLLDGTDPQAVEQGLRRLLHAGQRFRPKPAEILHATRQDPGRPTFAEALRLLFGPGGVIRARPPRELRRYADAGEKHRAEHQAMLNRAAELHPTIGAFVQRQGLDRLREMQLDDPDYGTLRRKELEAEWNAMLDRLDERQVAANALPVGDARRGELRAFDPLAALEPIAPAGALAAGSSSEEVVQHGHR